MAVTGDGAADYLASATTLTPMTSAYSWSIWYHPLGAPATGGAAKHAFALVNSGGSNPEGFDVNFAWDHPAGDTYKAAVHRNAGGTFALAQHPGTPASGDWHHVAAVFNGSTLKLYYDGIEVASVAASAPPGGDGNPEVTVLAWNSGASGFDDASAAELTIWNTNLSAADIGRISRGAQSNLIQPGNVVGYYPLNTGALTTTGPTLTNNGAAENTTYFLGVDGGLTVGGNTTEVTTAYEHTVTGGLTIGGNQTEVHSLTSFSSSLGVSDDAPEPVPRVDSAMSLTSTLSLPTSFAPLTSAAGFRSRFRASVAGELSNGRSRGRTSA